MGATIVLVRRFVTWAAGIIGLAALVRLIRGRRDRPADDDSGAGHTDPAVALRTKLAETRDEPAAVSSRAEENAAPPEEPAPDGATLDERRARIHEQARQAIDEMGGSDG